MSEITTQPSSPAAMTEGGGGIARAAPVVTFALVLTVTLYALWGMAHNLNDVLIAQFKKAFELNDLQSAMVQTAFYLPYLVMPIPVALYLQRYGYKVGVITGLLLYGLGALLFYPAAEAVTYGAFLGALCVIGCGLTFIETAGVGIITVLGDQRRAEWRINVAQAFNPMGSIIGIFIGKYFIFSGTSLSTAERAALSPAQLDALRATEAQAVQTPYLVIAGVVLLVALLIALTRFPRAATEVSRYSPFLGLRELLRSGVFRWGVIAQFFYVGTQIGIWSFIIRYAQQNAGMAERAASNFLLASLVLFLVGRFSTLVLLRRYSSAQIMRAFAAIAAALTLFAILVPGLSGLYALTAVSFFMSIMFPGIYAIGLHGNEEYSKPASALMIMSIVGGAILTAGMGAISDASSIAVAYLIPFVSFLIVLGYAAYAVRIGRTGAAGGMAH